MFSVAVTIDNKYIVSGSSDKRLIIWNILERRQETVLEGLNCPVQTVSVTSDNIMLFLVQTIRQ